MGKVIKTSGDRVRQRETNMFESVVFFLWPGDRENASNSLFSPFMEAAAVRVFFLFFKEREFAL